MICQKMLELGKNKSQMRELFEYGLAQAAVVGKENVFDFSIGNPSVPPPDAVGDAFVEVLNEPPLKTHGYTPAVGCDEARDAVAKHLSKLLGRKFSRRNIYITCGAAAAVMASLKGLCIDHETEFIVFAPYFPEYRCYVESAGAILKVVPADTDDFQINFDALEKAISPHTQGVIVNTPNNPTGAVYKKDVLMRLGDLLRAKSKEYGHTIYIISDEPYRELVYDNIEVAFVPDYYEDTIVCYSYSKTLSLPGDRIGYMCVPDTMHDFDEVCWATAGAARAMGYVCAPAIMQKVIARCADVPANLAVYAHNRKLLYEGLTNMGYDCVYPDGAFYLFVRAPWGTAKEFCACAKKLNVLIVPGDDFGCPTHFRTSYCVNPDTIERALPLFEQLIANAPDGSDKV
ncbi:MAG: pyridoxal phosphate-dependent aminotransferase [Eubacteriales bacterium]|nr:pyridoxal phosphate-dependent aminotransferase [Eubacteriales bacterium]